MKQRITVGLPLLAGVLWVIAGLRDIFAPGFFAMSGRLMSKSYITLEFAVAVVFFAVAALSSRSRQAKSLNHK